MANFEASRVSPQGLEKHNGQLVALLLEVVVALAVVVGAITTVFRRPV
jgi:hypothetical protein